MARSGANVKGLGLHPGHASGELMVLAEPLSLYGGVDGTGRIVASSHPQKGQSIVGKVVALPAARGSSSSASVLAELIRVGRGPAAMLMVDFDSVLVVGAIVAAELYGTSMPMVMIAKADFDQLAFGIADIEVDDVGGPSAVRVGARE